MLELKDYLSFGLGAAGTCLGVWNAWQNIKAGRVRLKVMPAVRWIDRAGNCFTKLGSGEGLAREIEARGIPAVAVEVTNLSAFPVTINEVGIRERSKIGRSPFAPAFGGADKPLPYRLEARTAVTYSAPEHYLRYPFSRETQAYVSTDCDHTVFGRGTIYEELRKVIASVAGRERL